MVSNLGPELLNHCLKKKESFLTGTVETAMARGLKLSF